MIGDELTEILLSPHAVNPRAPAPTALLPTYTITSNNLTANRALGLPSAYGRYHRNGTKCVFEDHVASPQHTGICPAATLCAEAQKRPGMTLVYTRQTALAEWLQLRFNVPCGSRLQLFAAEGCDLAATAAADALCADNGHVLVLMHSRLTEPSAMHFFANGELRSVASASHCVYMQQGVFWVDAVLLSQAPRQRQIQSTLQALDTQRSKSFSSQLLPLPGTWRRERHVLTLTPLQHMRLELLLERDAVPASVAVSVGVDDIQLNAVLSEFPATLDGQTLCTSVYVPSTQELQALGLRHLIRGNSSEDDWLRLHITVALSTRPGACQFAASLFYTLDDGTCTADDLEGHGLHRLGCVLSPKSEYVLGAYAECTIEVPAFLARAVGVAVVAVNSTVNSTCTLDHSAELVATLRAHTQLYSCPAAHFRDIDGACVSCLANTDFCPLGSRLRGCPALEPAAAENCIQCTEGRELVASGAATYVRSAGEYCSWNCSQGFFMFQLLGARTCRVCAQPPPGGCAAGTLWRECAPTHDAGCVPCPDIRLSSGPYAVNEEFLPTVNKSNTCQTQCKAGSYRSLDGLCKQCWGRAQLLSYT